MTVSVIGAGAIGTALLSRFTAAGKHVVVASKRGPAALSDLVTETGGLVRAVEVREALQADVVILAVPYDAVVELTSSVHDWSGRIVVDTTNAVEFPSFTPKDLGGKLSTEVIAEHLPGARVVKAFNTLAAEILKSEPRTPEGRRLIVVSGDDEDARKEIGQLVESLGFAALDLGKTQAGGKLQHFGGPFTGLNLLKENRQLM